VAESGMAPAMKVSDLLAKAAIYYRDHPDNDTDLSPDSCVTVGLYFDFPKTKMVSAVALDAWGTETFSDMLHAIAADFEAPAETVN
jgi:hypothetical protein